MRLQHLQLWRIMGEKRHMEQHFIPPDATIAELERKAADKEEKAANEPEPRATELREEAKLWREWATPLRSGRWTS
jgi:hypothetical protein